MKGDFSLRGLVDVLDATRSLNVLHSSYSVSAAAVALAAVCPGSPQAALHIDTWQLPPPDKWHWRPSVPSLLLPSVACEEAREVPDSYDAGAHISPEKIDTWQESKDPWAAAPNAWIGASWQPTAPKVYKVKLKPLVAVFYPRPLLITIIRSLLLNIIPVVEEYIEKAQEELEGSDDAGALPPVPDLVEPGKRSIWTALREVTVVTTRRLLERVIVLYVTPRTACKLIKDYYDSALRKRRRGLSGWLLFSKVCVTTFRGHLLSIAAQWIVHVSLETIRAGSRLYRRRLQWSQPDGHWKDMVKEEVTTVTWRSLTSLLRGCSALLGASFGAAAGTILWPGMGTWIGFVLGDIAGPSVVNIGLGRLL